MHVIISVQTNFHFIVENIMEEKEVFGNAEKWKPLSFTHVQYLEGDIFGFILALASLTPIFTLVAFATHIYFRREIHTVFYLAGLLLNEIVNTFLKLYICELRPKATHEQYSGKYGWPSAHSQFMGFFVTYGVLFCYIRLHGYTTWFGVVWKHGITVLGLVVTGLVCYSRIYLVYHTWSQVLAGILIGFILGNIWFSLTQVLFSRYFSLIVEHSICKFFMIRDSTFIPNVLTFEYIISRKEARIRSKTARNKNS